MSSCNDEFHLGKLLMAASLQLDGRVGQQQGFMGGFPLYSLHQQAPPWAFLPESAGLSVRALALLAGVCPYGMLNFSRSLSALDSFHLTYRGLTPLCDVIAVPGVPGVQVFRPLGGGGRETALGMECTQVGISHHPCTCACVAAGSGRNLLVAASP